ncbi:cytochrome d ubiquinol oxidase subunit II [Saxibacter everestensis]|uniref:Cytochrome d ubiquinol oxidase subunit II n=1 Tax=Saxibacter everestensis TaxID=2909229 RepID=A0ABY8QWC2_9MICO|nr:cytochrome d ubiquinol oxidase subunit II [Brevibacteriaceae bacterium ZFBP1038]
MEFLPTVWFILIAVLWTGYLFLEGFDLGVGMFMKLVARNEQERRLLLNTIGPVWDGNEVWLITAAGATFAAFPLWYASLFSGLYLPMLLVLLALIFRAVSIEYRGKINSSSWRARWDWGLSLGSLFAAFGVGMALAITTTGLPLNANGDRVGGPFSWFSWYAVLGGLAVVGFCLAHAAFFISLKTDGEMRHRARGFALRLLPLLLLPLIGWAVAVQLQSGKPAGLALIVVAVAAAAICWARSRAGREGQAFAAQAIFLLGVTGSIFSNVYPVVLPSTLDPANSLTVGSAAASDYTLGLMSIVACFGVPLVLAYQSWTYWVFRKRLKIESIPEPHSLPAAV